MTFPMKVDRTGYGAPAYEALVAAVQDFKAADPLDLVTVVVPSQLVAVTARRHLARSSNDGGGIAAVEFLTLRRIAERIAAPGLAASGRRPAVASVLAAAVRAELRQAPGLLAPVAEHDATVRAVVKTHRELRDISPTAVTAVAGSGALTADVVRLHRAVLARLSDWYDERDLLDAASAQAEAADLGRVVLFLPGRLAPAERELVSALAQAADVRAICGATGLERLDGWITALPGATDDDTERAEPIGRRLLHASDADDEVRCVVRNLVKAMETSAPHRVAILWSRADPYARLLADHLAAAGITWHGSGVAPLAERSVARGVLGLLALADDGLRRDAVFAWMAGTRVVRLDGTPVPSQRWERISRLAGVVEEGDWNPRLTGLADSLRADAAKAQESVDNGDDTVAWLIERNTNEAARCDELREFIDELRDRLAEIRAATSWSVMGDWIEAARREILGLADEATNLADGELLALLRIRSHARGLALLDDVDPVARLRDLRDGLEQLLTDEVPAHGRPGDGVFVGPVSAASGVLADRVFVVGLADDIYPGRIAEDALLPDEARAASSGELANLRDRIDDRHRSLLIALSAAPDVTVSFPRGDLRRSSERLPSRWILPTLRALAGNPKLEATKWESSLTAAVGRGAQIEASRSYAESIRTTATPTSEQEWRQRAAAGGDNLSTDPITTSGRTLLTARSSDVVTRFDGLIGASAPNPTDAGRAISPTSLEGWVKCPFSYFMSRLLRVNPVESPEDVFRISAPDKGNIVHQSFELLLEEGNLPAPTEKWSARHHRRLAEIALSVCGEYEARGLTGNPVLWLQDRAELIASLDKALDDDDIYRARRAATWELAELPIGRRGKPPVSVQLPDGSELLFNGYADRVDRADDGTLIVVDIKSGKSEGFKGLDLDNPTKGGSKLQLPIYGLAARQQHGTPDTKVEAEYWFVGRDLGVRIGYEITDQVLTEYARVLGLIVDGLRAGVFPLVPVAPTSWSSWVDCDYCDPDGLGTTERHRQWTAKSQDPALAAYLALVGES
jgi:RecB family exonuclease